jgi:hypothetical protein
MGMSGFKSENDIRISDVRKVLETMIKAQEMGNWDLFSACFAQNEDVVHIGTDVDEFWIGWTSFKRWMKDAILQRKGCKIEVKDTQIGFNRTGNVAWYSQLIDTSLETKGELTRIEGFRHSGVMEFMDNRWQIINSHVSAPVLEMPGREFGNNQYQYAF